jgi:hypothetical protein
MQHTLEVEELDPPPVITEDNVESSLDFLMDRMVNKEISFKFMDFIDQALTDYVDIDMSIGTCEVIYGGYGLIPAYTIKVRDSDDHDQNMIKAMPVKDGKIIDVVTGTDPVLSSMH